MNTTTTNTNTTNTNTTEALPKWTSEAGPIQTKRATKAIAAFLSYAKSTVEIYGTHGKPETERRSLVRIMGIGGTGSGVCESGAVVYRRVGESHGWTITAKNYKTVIADLEAGRAEVTLPVDDKRITPEVEAERAEASAKAAKDREESEAKRAEAWAAIEAKKPARAEAVIVAEYEQDESDTMTDYFATKTTRRVAIGWRTGKREDFRQLRAAAATFPETAHMRPGLDSWTIRAVDDRGEWARSYPGEDSPESKVYGTEAEALAAVEGYPMPPGAVEWRTRCESVEHRDNYSMGAGNYLKGCNRYSSGWVVRSYPLGNVPSWGAELEDATPDPAPATTPRRVYAPGGTGYTIEKHHHTKKGFDFYIVVLADRVDRAEFEDIRLSCKRAGGWYSRAWGGTPGGFAFREKADAVTWAASEFGDGSGGTDGPDSPDGLDTGTDGPDAGSIYAALVEAGAELDHHETDLYAKCSPAVDAIVEAYASRENCKRFTSQTDGGEWWDIPFAYAPAWEKKQATADSVRTMQQRRAEALREKAQRFREKAEDGRRERRENTPKQRKQAATARFEASNADNAARAADALADAWEAERVPPVLTGVTSAKDLAAMTRKRRDHAREGYYDVIPTNEYESKSEAAQALQAMIDEDGQGQTAEALRMETERVAVLDSGIPGFHPTPADIVAEMIEHAGDLDGARVLEPSAGRGDIATAARDAGATVCCVECSRRLCDILEHDGHDVTPGDFLVMDREGEPGAKDPNPAIPGTFDYVLMNPPFERRADANHVMHAWGFLKPGGRLVAVVSPGLFYASDRTATHFREWFNANGGERIRDIEPGSFANCGAGAVLISIDAAD